MRFQLLSAGALLTISYVLLTLTLPTAADGETVHGGWTDWSKEGSRCNATCGGGFRMVVRTCNRPSPQNGGDLCVMEDMTTRAAREIKYVPCATHPCMGNDTWSEWSNCTGDCAPGKAYRYALCGEEICVENQAATQVKDCTTWNITTCSDPCEKKKCPEYAICENKSNERRPKAVCKCTMGYQMNKAKTACLRPPPTTPTPRPIPTLPEEQKTVAVVVSKTASTVLIIFVGITLALFLLLRIFTPDRVIQMNMEIAIITAHVFLMFPPETVEVPTLCRIVSICVHFFFTACFMFMMLESLHMFSLVAYVVKKDGLLSRLQNTLVGWGLSAFVVLVTMCFEYENYGGVYHCWLQMDKPLIIGQFVPVIIIMVITFTLIEAAGAADYKQLKDVDKTQRLSARISQRSNLVILILVFISWVLGMLSEYEQNLALYGSFSVLNGVVGGVIFFFHCSGNQQVRTKLMKMYQSCRRRRRR